MKKYIVILLLVAIGVGASLFMIPNQNEVALIQLKDKRYDEALKVYEQKLNEGALTIDVVSALTDLYLQYGNIDKAIDVMERFVRENPTSIEARNELGRIYQYAQRPDDYLRNLEEVNRLKGGDQKALSEMADMYGASENYSKQEPALELLMEHNVKKEPHHYLQLANLQASKKKFPEAVATLREFRQKFPKDFKFPQSEMLITLILEMKDKQEEAFMEAKTAASQTQNPQEIARLVNIMHYRGSPQLGMRLLEPYDTQVKQFPELAAEKAYILVNMNKQKEAYELLTWLYEQDKLPDTLRRDYMSLALANGDEEVALNLVDSLDLRGMNEEQAISVLEMAMFNSNDELRKRIYAKFKDFDGAGGMPTLSALLSIDQKKSDALEKIASLESVTMSNDRAIMIASACATRGYRSCADDMVQRIDQSKLDEKGKIRIANLYLQIGQIADARTIIDPLYEATPEAAEVSQLRAKIAAYEGDTTFVERWLTANPDATLKEYKDLFFMAQDYRKVDTALFIAEKMHTTFNNDESRDLLVNSLMANKRYAEALPYLRELKSYSEQDRNNYLSVLMDLAKKNPGYNKELANFAATELRGNVSKAQKQALIYALLDAGRADLALPFIKEFARTQGGDWVEVYAQNLDKLGRNSEARDFRMQLANDPRTAAKTRRDIGFVLLDKGYKDDSMTVFANLAANADPQSQDVRQLLYLWGPRLTTEQLDWMTERALNSSSNRERMEWMKYINSYADAGQVIDLAERHPDLMGDPQLLDSYMNSMHRMGKIEQMGTRISQLAEKTDNTVLLRSYARAVRGYSLDRLAQKAYKKLDIATGGDPEAERNLGLIAFNQADYSETKKYLQNYVNFRDKNKRYHADDYQAYFYLAESYRRDRNMKQAEPYYKTVLKLLGNIKTGRSADMEARAAQSMVALGSKEAGYKIFEDAMKRFPNDALLRADYVSTLVESKDYAKAEEISKNANLSAGKTAGFSTNPLVLNVAKLEGYRTFVNDNEILLEFKDENDTNRVNLTAEELRQYPWLSYSTQGYDRALLVAKPDYKLTLKPTSGGYMIVPETDIATNNNDAKFRNELALRYKMLQARINLETGKQYQATEDLNAALPANKGNATLMAYTGNAENFVGRWKHALRLLDDAAVIMPENEDIQQLQRDIRLDHSSHAKLDYEWFKLGDSVQNIWTASALAFINDEWEVGGNVQVNNIDAENVRRTDGRFGNFDDTVTRGEVFVAKETEDGTRIQASLFANDNDIGAGAYYGWFNRLGETQVYAEYHRPNWDFVEGVLDGAVRDRVGVTHFIQINPRWSVTGGIAFNKYHVEDEDDVAETVSVSGNITRQLKEVNPYLATSYALDAEYRTDDKGRVAADGTPYQPLMDDREVHSLSVIAADKFGENTEGLVQAGYAYDRITEANGPLFAAEVTHQMLDERLEAQLRASYGTFTSDNVGDAARAGGYLKWRF